MSLDENRAVVRRYFEEVLTRGNLAALDEIATPDYYDYGYVKAGFPLGVATFHRHAETFLEHFAEVVATVDDLIAEDDQVVAI